MTAPVHPPIVVGIDADPSCRVALAWAADDAQRRHLPLHLVFAWREPANRRAPGPTRLPGIQQTDDPLSAAERTLREAVAFVRHRHSQVAVSTLLAAGAPVPVLRRQARTAAAVVLGSRRLGRREGPFGAGSVALSVVAHGNCPVVMVRDREFIGRQPPFFVVGVNVGWDGRRHSAAAVIHAFEEAARRGAALRLLYIWRPPLLGVLDERTAVRECRRLLSDMVAGWRITYPDVEVHHAVLLGHPAALLAEESVHALALIVGSHGHGLTGLLRGSVVSRAVRHAQCSVIAVPRLGVHRQTHGGPGISWLSHGVRAAVGRYARPLASFTVRRPRRHGPDDDG